jgi:Gamma-glutamyl cyclotransferase, AIG2-like
LHEEGWGADMGYPGIVLNSEGDEIEGFLFTSENLASSWFELDEFEGKEYERVLTKVKLGDESFVDAYVYTIRKN